jgi:aminomethyltransferase
VSAGTTELSHTVLHDWHASNGGKMVPFAGYDMPVQYALGIIDEHMATRREAGLFDVSHMGRFRVRGAAACAFLSRILSCNVEALVAGKAAYGFLATPSGGALDDAYLYMLAEHDYLLVVNASNRSKDWAWLHDLLPADVSLEDDSERLAMLALQGPKSQFILESLTDAATLPANKRNLLSTCQIDGHSVLVARTGYTGESVCFELFPSTDYAVVLWQKMIDLGATAVGLGARDSLRLQAGLPLYGHELGDGPDGREIPVFSNPLARFAVRNSDGYIGCEAIAQQRIEYLRIKRAEFDNDWQPALLSHMVRPIAVFDSKRPLRAGYRVLRDGLEVGWVTSGAIVPCAPATNEPATASAGDQRVLRPIGLSLIHSNIRFDANHRVTFAIADDRGKTFDAELVERNL